MKVLLVTGRLAREIVEHYAKQTEVEAVVTGLPVPVASLLTPEYIARSLGSIDHVGFDLILVPGLVKGDVSIIEETSGIPTFKGPRYAADLPTLLVNLNTVELSKVAAADEVLGEATRTKLVADLEERPDQQGWLLSQPGNFLLGKVPIGRGFPMRVMAEILNAPLLPNDELSRLSGYYLRSGAYIIDVGMLPGRPRPDDAARAVRTIKAEFDAPVAIDTFSLEEAEAAVNAGVDMLLSLDASNITEASRFATRLVVVVLPGDHRQEPVKKASARVRALADNVADARYAGFTKVVADPVLDVLNVPGLTESLVAYHAYSAQYPDVPMLFGAGNITELLDADSTGVNALLAGLASEIGVSVLLTTEGSHKTIGSVSELSTAAKMMLAAKRRHSVPKDLGLDLLVLKEKRGIEETPSESYLTYAKTIEAEPCAMTPIDPEGNFRIVLDRKKNQIMAIHSRDGNPTSIVRGEDACSIYSGIISSHLVTRLDHAAYLGSELTKAEIALKTGKSYIQDSPLFQPKTEG
jgi:dihydropteroate synthase-like protein